ncbi:hypothetical protein GA0074695_4304 [Micromonospora viridifaciens]|uniref:Uncharacterized protein n=1 Tax=Micromonospora viridifaciens TaxID=1881 RepID=A0A1C4YI10_MICVI|nr:hypothetical protein [Micromonospora viridifaciens]SCF20310.1 hypothetical protein GA0074695_4304 [Micromonospora viridifaciens]
MVERAGATQLLILLTLLAVEAVAIAVALELLVRDRARTMSWAARGVPGR